MHKNPLELLQTFGSDINDNVTQQFMAFGFWALGSGFWSLGLWLLRPRALALGFPWRLLRRDGGAVFLELYQCALGCAENIKFSFEEGNELELETMFLNEQFLPNESENFVFRHALRGL